MADTPELTPEIIALIRRLPDIATTLTNLAAQVSSSVSSLGERVSGGHAAIQTAMDNLRAAVQGGRIELRDAVLDEVVKTRAEIMNRIDRLQGTVDLIHEDGRVNWATANTAFNRNMSTRDDMDSVLQTIQAMERRYQTLMAMVQELREQNEKKPPRPIEP